MISTKVLCFMAQHYPSGDRYIDTVHMLTVVIPHLVILVVTLLSYFQGRRIRRRVKRVESTLHTQVHLSADTKKLVDKQNNN